ncbi:MAG: hypothetical protein RLZZ174_1901 [Pseudomonadota bacterium]
MAAPWVQAYVLHQRPFRDSRVIVELMTEAEGRLGAVYRRGPGRKAVPQAFVLGEWQLAGQGDLRTAYAVQPLAHHTLAGQSLFSGLYLNELLLRLLPREVPAPELFSAYGAALQGLRLAPRAEPLILRRFEWACLEALGVAFSLTEDVAGEPLRPNSRYGLDPGRGLYALSSPGEVGWMGAHLLGLAEEQFDDPAVRRVAQALLGKALAPQLGGRPLAAARFLLDAQERSP